MTMFGDKKRTLVHDTRRYGDENKLGYPANEVEQIFLERFEVYGFFPVRNVKKR